MAVLDPNEIFYTAYEPKQANRFILYMDGFPSYIIKQISSFAIENGEVILQHINVDRKIKGKSKWGDVTLNLYDPVTPSGAQAVMEWARLSYESVTGRAGYSDFYKKDLTLNILGPVGDIIGEWVIKGAFLTNGDFGQYDWASDEVVDLSITVAMDYCILNY